ncbi:hypothetical protein LSH36_539g01000 [Paralvinella palmiformis]|uniref:Armadillo repeat-containing protein 7 n=1 Tax=Paralvinella palmiformis TaxID=53620 RepID=A0AAD9J737_9ANNE|nr:hypothetical protein LSH36_539g01000 [Paralvinella palmiformis]
MFSTQEYLDKKTGPYGIGRFSYLQSLVTEFQDTDSEEAKLQVLANLTNFAYDPINYEYIRHLKIIDLFLDITAVPVVDAMLRFKKSKNTRLSNLAVVFLEDYCSQERKDEALKLQAQWDSLVQAQAQTSVQGYTPNTVK